MPSIHRDRGHRHFSNYDRDRGNYKWRSYDSNRGGYSSSRFKSPDDIIHKETPITDKTFTIIEVTADRL